MYDFTVILVDLFSCRQSKAKIKRLETVPYERKATGMYF